MSTTRVRFVCLAWSYASPGPWSRRCERRPAGSGAHEWGRSALPTARSCAGRQSRPCEWATPSRSVVGDQTSDWCQTDIQAQCKKKTKQLQPALITTVENSLIQLIFITLTKHVCPIYFSAITRGSAHVDSTKIGNSEKGDKRFEYKELQSGSLHCNAAFGSKLNWVIHQLKTWQEHQSITSWAALDDKLL